MSTIQTSQFLRRPSPSANRDRLAAIGCDRSETFRGRLDHRQFEVMTYAFRPHGGFVCGDDVARRLRRSTEPPTSTIERWVAARSALNIWWHDQTLMPVFQFDLEDMSIRPACARVNDELKAVFDDWELALWFATSNIWLSDAAPVSLIAVDSFAVLQAARADRFIACG